MSKLIIRIEDWDHTCSDGCCYTYGKDCFINDEKITQEAENPRELIEALLNYLKIEYEIV